MSAAEKEEFVQKNINSKKFDNDEMREKLLNVQFCDNLY